MPNTTEPEETMVPAWRLAIAEFRGEMKTDFTRLRGEVSADFARVNGRIDFISKLLWAILVVGIASLVKAIVDVASLLKVVGS